MGQVELVTAKRDAYCINHWTVYKWVKSPKLGGFPDQVLNPEPHEYKAGVDTDSATNIVVMKMFVINYCSVITNIFYGAKIVQYVRFPES
jgi:hypothetical protein